VSELPTGTVSFLFSDIEKSTQVLQRLRSGYGDVLADHREVLRAAFAENHGREIGTHGDELFVAFWSAKDAVLAAAHGQRALAGHDWPEGAAINVRMGLHTGEPMVVEANYVGVSVHRAARISAAAHGGQVLLSRATAGVVADEEIAGVRLLDLGEHRLRNLDGAERIYQLAIEGLPQEFPPLRTTDADDTISGGGQPSGTITFLFTDIEGSTRMIYALGRERFADVLGSYHRGVRGVLVDHGGEDVQALADAQFASFPNAVLAVRAAAAVQRWIAAAEWPEGREPRTRIGLHTGEAGMGIQRYVGLTPNRTAEICAAAHGGQVLLTEATRSVLDTVALEGLALRDLGEYQTQSFFGQPIRLYQIEAPGLPTGFQRVPSGRTAPWAPDGTV
jgi:class 3 adenylate cyclase